ncbi:MAG: hypothetical protein NZ703_10835 [Gemmataceae bacterium]|nr:hypothetical protein [Gemmataceae bacterium]MCS7271572.1 hypothetical protein [Gemmataceae bacterium]MDW8243341.1 hypothetical protein [Thermogemmata sp.]
MSSPTYPQEYQTYGLPVGTVRGFLSVLICSFFWIVLMFPSDVDIRVPLGHFFLLTLVFLAFASQPLSELHTRKFLPWLMRFIFVGGSVAVIAYVLYVDPHRLLQRLTPNPEEIGQWPVLLACLAGGFGAGLLVRFVLGRTSPLFMTLRAWIGIVAMLLLLFEPLFQFIIIPNMSDKPSVDTLKVWEGVLIAVTASYFGTRA